MGFGKVLLGMQEWSDYSTGKDIVKGFDHVIQKRSADMTLQIRTNQQEQQLALKSGLGALGENISHGMSLLSNSIEVELNKFRDGIDKLNADFNLLMGDVIWKLQIQQETFNSILQEIRIAEFEREARAYRIRGEDSYFNGWYDKALEDFLKAEARNYKDFAVLRSIGNIYLYEIFDLPKALEYFRKTAKYARPFDPRLSAEAYFFAGTVCGIQQHLVEGLSELQEAIKLNPSFYQAYYLRSSFFALLGDSKSAIENLEVAIKGDSRYYERVKNDIVFDKIRADLEIWLDKLKHNVREDAKNWIDDLKLANDTVQKARAENCNEEINNFEELYNQDTYSVYLELVPQVKQSYEQTFVNARQSLERQIKEKQKRIANFQQSVENLENEEEQIERKLTEETSFGIATGYFIGSLFVFFILMVIYVTATGKSANLGDCCQVPIFFGLAVSGIHYLGSGIYYNLQIKKINEKNTDRRNEIRPVVRNLDEEVKQLNENIEKCRNKQHL